MTGGPFTWLARWPTAWPWPLRRGGLLLAATLLVGVTALAQGQSPVQTAPPPQEQESEQQQEPEQVRGKGEKGAKLRVSGFGLLGSRQLRNLIRRLQSSKEPPLTYDANFIEDAALVLFNRLSGEGYLKPDLTLELTLEDGRTQRFEWGRGEEFLLPRPLAAREVHFRFRKGVLYYYHQVTISGLTAIPLKEARGFFYRSDFLLPVKTPSRFSPDRLDTAVSNLRRALLNLGYREAQVTVDSLEQDAASGKVALRVSVQEGPVYQVESVEIMVCTRPGEEPLRRQVRHPQQPFSLLWEQDLSQELAAHEFALGYPDTEVKVSIVGQSPLPETNRVEVRLQAQVVRGEPVRLGQVEFQGYEHARLSMLQRKVRLEGPELNRLEVDRARERIARLGIFKFIDVRYDPEEGSPRDVIFELQEGPRIDTSLLFGYGSYDLAFGGVELNQFNLFGIGHNQHLRAVQSFKSTVGNYTYSVPEFLGRDLSLFGSAEGLRREEVSFDREELILSVGGRKSFLGPGLQAGLRYAYEFLDARTAPETVAEDSPNQVAAFIVDLLRERRDNPLAPKRGSRLYTAAEFANPSLGGEADYQRVEFSSSWHQPLGGGRYLHLGLNHGVAFAPDPGSDLPFNKRFFPGGENSIRGYQRGEASPLNEQGDEIGAESVIEWNLELEQALTPTWSVVGFVDGGAIAEHISDWPGEDVLWSAGGGLRWNTVVGPVRLEYGYNLNPRPDDPVGTLHFSIGYPF